MFSQLDDWVLCRVRHKGYSSKNSCENHGNHCELIFLSNLPRGEEYPTNMKFQADMITNYQYKDYHILASILFSGPIPSTENMPSLNKVNPHMTIPPLDCYFNTQKRKSNEHNQHENLVSFNRKFNNETK